jgi:hypothetical protein
MLGVERIHVRVKKLANYLPKASWYQYRKITID